MYLKVTKNEERKNDIIEEKEMAFLKRSPKEKEKRSPSPSPKKSSSPSLFLSLCHLSKIELPSAPARCRSLSSRPPAARRPQMRRSRGHHSHQAVSASLQSISSRPRPTSEVTSSASHAHASPRQTARSRTPPLAQPNEPPRA